MKKALILLTCLFLLSGCSIIADTYNGSKLADEMEKLVNQENSNDQIMQKMTDVYGQIDQIANSSSNADGIKPEDAKKVLSLLEEAKKQVPVYKEAVQKVQSQFPTLKEKAAKLEEEKAKKLADKFINDFSKTTETELEFTKVYEELIALDEVAFKAIAAGKQPPKQDRYDQLVQKYNDLNNQLENQIKQFNQSWNDFNQSVTGQKVEGQ